MADTHSQPLPAAQSFLARLQNKVHAVVLSRICEKEYSAENGQTLRYMFFPAKSDTLVIGFQACNDAGARYNYVTTLRSCKVNCLFIKDDFGPDGFGDYYLGCNGTYSVEDAVMELIGHYTYSLSPKRLIFAGSSKGGYAALSFGLRFPDAEMIIAAPQYRLGDYLWGDNGDGRFASTVEEILGEPASPDGISMLNHRLAHIIQNDQFADTQQIFIHYSAKEHTYPEHIQYLLQDLEKKRIYVEKDEEDYTNHGDLKYYFPEYLKEKVKQSANRD